jgi:hypothetical protein
MFFIKVMTMTTIINKIAGKILLFFINLFQEFKSKIKNVSINGIEWTSILALHAVTVPTLLSLMAGLTDRTPPIDMVIIVWAALGLLFMKSLMKRDMTSIALIGFGFIGQATLIALIFFK